MIIGIIPDPLNHPDWPKIKAFLEPAARQGALPVLDTGEAVVAVYMDRLVGAATIRRTQDGFGEVVLVGGERYREWIKELDEMIAAIMRREGMTSIRAFGRKGWVRVLKKWNVIGDDGETVGYERLL